MKQYEVIENSGYDDEFVVIAFSNYIDAVRYLFDHYTNDEIKELSVDILYDGSTEY